MEHSQTNTASTNEGAVTLILFYPAVLLLIGTLLNIFVLKVNPCAVALPAMNSVRALVAAAILLLVNHSWLMTATEVTRARFKMFATPEEWIASGTKSQDASAAGLRELKRHHNAHRNATENTVYYALLSFIFVMVSPTTIAALIWLIVFPIARLGHTYSYLHGRDNARGVFMTLSLLSVYGMGSYLASSPVRLVSSSFQPSVARIISRPPPPLPRRRRRAAPASFAIRRGRCARLYATRPCRRRLGASFLCRECSGPG